MRLSDWSRRSLLRRWTQGMECEMITLSKLGMKESNDLLLDVSRWDEYQLPYISRISAASTARCHQLTWRHVLVGIVGLAAEEGLTLNSYRTRQHESNSLGLMILRCLCRKLSWLQISQVVGSKLKIVLGQTSLSPTVSSPNLPCESTHSNLFVPWPA